MLSGVISNSICTAAVRWCFLYTFAIAILKVNGGNIMLQYQNNYDYGKMDMRGVWLHTSR